MARINVEDSWYVDVDQKRHALIEAIQSEPRNVADEADGKALRAWRLAQKYWADGRKLIPLKIWKRAKLDILLDPEIDLAEIRDDGVYVRGSENEHNWIESKTKGGKERAKGPRDERGRLLPTLAIEPALQLTPAAHQQDPAEPPADSSNAGDEVQQDPAEPPADSSSSPASSLLFSCSTLAPILTPYPSRNPEDEIPIPEEPRSTRFRGPHDSAIAAIMQALHWEGENLKSAIKGLSPLAIELLTAFGGTGKCSEGLKIAWQGCRREPASGLAGDLFRDDAAGKVADEFRRIARRARQPKEKT